MGEKTVTSHSAISQGRKQTSESVHDPLKASQWEEAGRGTQVGPAPSGSSRPVFPGPLQQNNHLPPRHSSTHTLALRPIRQDLFSSASICVFQGDA